MARDNAVIGSFIGLSRLRRRRRRGERQYAATRVRGIASRVRRAKSSRAIVEQPTDFRCPSISNSRTNHRHDRTFYFDAENQKRSVSSFYALGEQTIGSTGLWLVQKLRKRDSFRSVVKSDFRRVSANGRNGDRHLVPVTRPRSRWRKTRSPRIRASLRWPKRAKGRKRRKGLSTPPFREGWGQAGRRAPSYFADWPTKRSFVRRWATEEGGKRDRASIREGIGN